jgi:hypothetical protein
VREALLVVPPRNSQRRDMVMLYNSCERDYYSLLSYSRRRPEVASEEFKN